MATQGCCCNRQALICAFFTYRIDYLDRITWLGLLKIANQIAYGIHKLKKPTMVTELRVCLGKGKAFK